MPAAEYKSGIIPPEPPPPPIENRMTRSEAFTALTKLIISNTKGDILVRLHGNEDAIQLFTAELTAIKLTPITKSG